MTVLESIAEEHEEDDEIPEYIHNDSTSMNEIASEGRRYAVTRTTLRMLTLTSLPTLTPTKMLKLCVLLMLMLMAIPMAITPALVTPIAYDYSTGSPKVTGVPFIEFVQGMKLDDVEPYGALEPRGVSTFMSTDPHVSCMPTAVFMSAEAPADADAHDDARAAGADAHDDARAGDPEVSADPDGDGASAGRWPRSFRSFRWPKIVPGEQGDWHRSARSHACVL